MKKFLSFLLAFVLTITTFAGVLPPLEASAASAASISSLRVSPDEGYEGDSLQVKGTVKSGSGYYLRAIQINVRNEGDNDHGFRVDRVDFDYSQKKTSYSLSNLDEFDIGSYICTGCGKREYLDVGEHRIDVSVGLYDSKGNVATYDGITKSVWFEVLEEESPQIEDIDADVDGTEVTFTVKTNLSANYGIVLYADEYRLDKIEWDKDKNKSYIEYVGTHVFNQTGERRITVYALDEEGDIIQGSEDTITIVIDSLGQCGAPTITTANNQKIEVGNSFRVAWKAPSKPTGVTLRYNVYLNNGTSNILVGENLTTTSCTIPASKLNKVGTYVISVIAMATDYTQSDDDDAAINLTVNGAEKTIVGYKYFSSVLRHRVEYSDGSYEMEDCQQGMCVCGRPYKVDHNAEQTPIEYAWFKDNMKHHVVYANGTDAIEDCASVDCVCGRPSTVVENPSLIEVKAVAGGMTGFFTVKGNTDAKYGIVLYADGYKLDKIVWTYSESNGTITYTGEHIFNQPGTRNIVVYALDKDGNELKSDGKFASTSIVLEPDGRCDSPIITTINNQKLEVGNSFKVSWNKPATPAGVTFKYNVYVNNGTTNVCVAEQIFATSYTIPANKLNKAGVYTISVIAMATGYQQSDDDDATINLNVVAKETVEKITLATPRVSGSSKIQYGDDYTISWDFDAQVDYYQITIDGLSYKKTVDATEKSFTIPGSVFKQYSGADTNYTISLVAMSHDTEKYLPSEAATIRVNVAGYSESNALIKSAEILDGNEIIAGTVVRFKVVTTKDVTALRMKDGAGSFIVNTWYASEIGTNTSNAQYYKDSGNERTWYIQQKVNHAGDEIATGAKRLLTFYSMVNEVEYNNCSVSFYCKKGNDVIGAFEITSPSNNEMLPSGKDIVINWSAPTNTTVDYYIIDIYHGDVCVDRATVNGTTYTLAGALLEKDNVAWQIRVTARKDDGQWAESVSTASFKLECTHEHLGQPTENILSYAQKNDTTHSCVVEKTHACLDCGLANAKKVQETVTKSHNWLALDKGGKVCNQCWHLQSDGSFTVKKDMQLSSLAGNREFVYFNVDASGNPANKQNGRYVDKTDKITILGEVGNCYLIEYPITVNARAGGSHKGIILKNKVSTQTNNVSSKTHNQIIVEQFIDELFERGLLTTQQYDYIYEYNIATLCHMEENQNYDWGDSALHTLFSGDIIGKTFKYICDSSEYGREELVYPFLHTVICSMPMLEENTGKKEEIKFPNENSQVWEGMSGIAEIAGNIDTINKGIDDFKSLEIDDAAQYLLNYLNPELDSILNKDNLIEELPDDPKGKEEALLAIYCVSEYLNYRQFTIAAEMEYFEVLLDSIDDNAENRILRDTIIQMRDEYENAEIAAINSMLNVFEDKIREATLDFSAGTIISAFGCAFGGQIIFVAKAADFAISLLSKVTGAQDFVNSKDAVAFYGFMPQLLKEKLIERLNNYDGSIESANYIVAHYNLWRSVQIYFNEATATITGDLNKKTILSKEVEHIKNSSIQNWSMNPYYASPNLSKPDVSRFEKLNNGIFYQTLLMGKSENDKYGLLKHWDMLCDYERKLIISEVDALYEFAQSDVEKVLIMDVGSIYWVASTKEHMFIPNGIALIFVNAAGEGLIIRYIDNTYNNASQDYQAFKVVGKEYMDNILLGKAELPNEYYATLRHHRTGYTNDQFDLSKDGLQSVIFVNADKGKSYCSTGYRQYISLQLGINQFNTICNEYLLSKEYFGRTNAHIDLMDELIADVWNVWIWYSSDIPYIARKFNERAEKTGDESIKVSVTNSDWDD